MLEGVSDAHAVAGLVDDEGHDERLVVEMLGEAVVDALQRWWRIDDEIGDNPPAAAVWGILHHHRKSLHRVERGGRCGLVDERLVVEMLDGAV